MSRSWKPGWPSVCTVTHTPTNSVAGATPTTRACAVGVKRHPASAASSGVPNVSNPPRSDRPWDRYRTSLQTTDAATKGAEHARGAMGASSARIPRGTLLHHPKSNMLQREAVGACLNPLQTSLPARDSRQRRPCGEARRGGRRHLARPEPTEAGCAHRWAAQKSAHTTGTSGAKTPQ